MTCEHEGCWVRTYEHDENGEVTNITYECWDCGKVEE
jgi:hypothetical protein